MLNRRTLMAALAASPIAAPAEAQTAGAHTAGAQTAGAQTAGWAAQYPELVYAVVPAENAQGVTGRYGPFVEYLARQLGTKVTLRIANDYAAVIEGQRAGNIHIGGYGPASFARALVTGVKTTAFAIKVNGDGTKGYHSVLYVLASSPYHSVEDLKGRDLGLVDPNSTSGYNMPLFALDKRGIDARRFFGKVLVTGSHENAVLALTQGTVQVCANWWNAPDDSNLTRMLRKGMVKHADGTPMTTADFRIVMTSPLIINSPVAYLDSLPDALKAAIRAAFNEAPEADRAAFARLSDGHNLPFAPVDNAAYDDTIKLIRFVDRLRKTDA